MERCPSETQNSVAVSSLLLHENCSSEMWHFLNLKILMPLTVNQFKIDYAQPNFCDQI